MALGKISNEPESFTFAFSEEKRWAVFVWESAPKQYFIVTPEPSVSITEVIDYFNIFRASSAAATSVFTYIIRSRGYLMQPCDLFQKLLIYLFHFYLQNNTLS
jgi:hypothetical protein